MEFCGVPNDKNYSTTVHNDPVAVAYPTSAQQVAGRCRRWGAQNLEVVARSGGHSYIANGLGGNNGSLVVDLSKLKAVTIRSSNNTAIIETGNRLGMYYGRHTAEHGNTNTFAASNIPPEFGAELVFSKGPSNSHITLGWTGAYYGSPSTFNATLAPYLKTLPKPSWSTISPGSYINSVSVLAATFEHEHRTRCVRHILHQIAHDPRGSPMSAAAIKAFVTYMANQGFTSNTNWFVEVELYGGSNSAINAVPLDSTAFAKRDTLFTIQLYASSASGSPPYPAAGFTFLDGMVASIVSNSPANWSYGAYLNYADNRLANATTLYYGSHYPRLVSIKSKVDPKDIFRFPIGVA
ncbi:hypothetical protein B0H10DRAFT_2243380 [Mycena sp. CBHHK59/15]|nr:hypothetical protein B0H10DRAFT_2243380 [Mycena sp. CBHHK59/15]